MRARCAWVACVWVCSLPPCIIAIAIAITIVRVSIANQRLTNLHAFLSPRTQPGIGAKIMAWRHYFRWIGMNDRRRERVRRGCQIDVWIVIRRSHSRVCSRNHLFIFISIYAQRSHTHTPTCTPSQRKLINAISQRIFLCFLSAIFQFLFVRANSLWQNGRNEKSIWNFKHKNIEWIYPCRYTLIAFHFIYLMRHLMHFVSHTATIVGIFQSICIGVATKKTAHTHIPAVETQIKATNSQLNGEKKCDWKGISVEIKLKIKNGWCEA